ncbi:MAG: ATP-binding protein, partial [Rhodospirillales bacterium]|nr:ATP-binding protein [Rhodospirillales bacterium]
IAEDITERRMDQDNLQTLRSELAHVSRLSNLGEMAAAFAHELNQPLSVISNYSGGLLRRRKDPDTRDEDIERALQSISDQAFRASDIIGRIRRFIDKKMPKAGSIDVNETIMEAADLLKSEALGHGVKLRLELDRKLPRVMADPVEVQQVVINLARNGMEALPSDQGAERNVTIRTRSHNGKHIAIAVSDTGYGIPPELRKRLFEPFFTTKPDGMGIGLLICRRIVESIGGYLMVESEQNRGTTISVVLPTSEMN